MNWHAFNPRSPSAPAHLSGIFDQPVRVHRDAGSAVAAHRQQALPYAGAFLVPLRIERIAERWFSLPNFYYLPQVPFPNEARNSHCPSDP